MARCTSGRVAIIGNNGPQVILFTKYHFFFVRCGDSNWQSQDFGGQREVVSLRAT